MGACWFTRKAFATWAASADLKTPRGFRASCRVSEVSSALRSSDPLGHRHRRADSALGRRSLRTSEVRALQPIRCLSPPVIDELLAHPLRKCYNDYSKTRVRGEGCERHPDDCGASMSGDRVLMESWVAGKKCCKVPKVLTILRVLPKILNGLHPPS